jgi:SAM-dependent methyltransferase
MHFHCESIPHKNVVFKRVDLAGKKIDLPTVDFAFCCNVAMSDNLNRNQRILSNVVNALNKGGVALIVLPSYESASISVLSLIRWYEKEGVELAQIPKADLSLLRTQNKNIPAKEFFPLMAFHQTLPGRRAVFNVQYRKFFPAKTGSRGIWLGYRIQFAAGVDAGTLSLGLGRRGQAY